MMSYEKILYTPNQHVHHTDNQAHTKTSEMLCHADMFIANSKLGPKVYYNTTKWYIAYSHLRPCACIHLNPHVLK